MFTGIISCIGKITINGSILKIIVPNQDFLISIKTGDSISVNGICLTVINFDTNNVEFFMMEETQRNAHIKNGYVNLERALKLNNDISGHITTGHINNIGIIQSITENIDTSKIFIIKLCLEQNIKYKDSIAVNGVSLTVSEISDKSFGVCLIPHTIEHTTFKYLKEGDKVNIEYGISESKNIDYMSRAITLSEYGRCTTIPNPWVGCVIVKNDVIIGEGYHIVCGGNHAEKNAIDDAIIKGNKELIKGSDVYVTLEPCNNYGRTPPCDKMLVEYGVKKVIIGQNDTDVINSNKGLNYLRDNGVIVEFSHQNQVSESLKSYNHSRLFKKPYCILKVAVSLDGKISTEIGDSKWISNEKSRAHVQKLRSKCHGIIVGSKTVLKDNPFLNVRDFVVKKQPLRIVLDTNNSLTDKSLNIFNTNTSDTLIFTSKIPDTKIDNVEYKVVNILDGKLDLEEIMLILNKKGIMQCLVEGGSELYTSFIQSGLAQEVYMYRSNINLGCCGLNWVNYKGHELVNENERWDLLKVKQFDNDVLCIYKIPEIKNLQIKTSIPLAIEAIKNGKPIIIMDSTDRENEGDLVVSGEKITEEMISLMMRYTTGIICVTMTEDRAKRLRLPPMTTDNEDPNGTNFMISCDYVGSSTGISASERTKTIEILSSDTSIPENLSRPGHVFPLVGHKDGLVARQGHTESSINICELAGLKPIAVISELVNPNGKVMRYSDCERFAKMYDIPLITIDDLLKYQSLEKRSPQKEAISILKPDVESVIMTKKYGEWKLLIYKTKEDDFAQTHRVLIKNSHLINDNKIICVRVHSDCYTGDVLGSSHCDCGDQLDLSLKMITDINCGVIIFPANHEGRGIGLINKLKAYNLIRETKCDTYTANNLIGYDDDIRTYDFVPGILDNLKITSIELLTNNKNKISVLGKYTKKVTPLIVPYNVHNIDYMKIKNEKYGYDQLTFENKINEKYNIAIITTNWHNDLLELTKKNMVLKFGDHHNVTLYTVPGAFELPLAAKNIINKTKCDIVVCLGLILKGDTAHFEYISNASINGLMNVQLETNVPIINGVLNCFTLEQANQRLDPINNFSTSLVNSSLEVIYLKNSL